MNPLMRDEIVTRLKDRGGKALEKTVLKKYIYDGQVKKNTAMRVLRELVEDGKIERFQSNGAPWLKLPPAKNWLTVAWI